MLKTVLGFISIVLIWGSTWLAIKWGYESFPPFIGSGIRFLTASVILGIIIWIRKDPFPKKRSEWLTLLSLGILGFAFAYGVVYVGQQYIPSGLGAILFATYPFWVAMGNAAFLHEIKLTPVRLLAMILGFGGIVIIFHHQIRFEDWTVLIGMSLIVLSAVTQAFNLITIKKWGMNISHYQLNFIPMVLGGSILFLIGWVAEGWQTVTPTAKGLLSTAYLAVVGSALVFIIYWWLVKRLTAISLSLSAFLTPIVAVFVGWLLGGEVLDSRVYLGASVTLTGIILYNLGDLAIRKLKSG